MTSEQQLKSAFGAYVAVLTRWATKAPAEDILKPWPRSVTTAAQAEFVRIAGTAYEALLEDGIKAGVKVPGFTKIPEERENAIKLANPYASAYAQQALPDLVVEIERETMGAIQEVIKRGFADEMTVAAMARRIRGYQPQGGGPRVEGIVGLTDAWAAAVDKYRVALVRQGYTPDEVNRHAGTYAKRLRARRGENIARTETQRAQNRGTQIAWETAQNKGMMALGTVQQWITAWDDRTCPICAPLDRQIAPIGGSFPGGLDGPPAHPNCRCTVSLTTPTSTRGLPTPASDWEVAEQAARNAEYERNRPSLKPTER